MAKLPARLRQTEKAATPATRRREYAALWEAVGPRLSDRQCELFVRACLPEIPIPEGTHYGDWKNLAACVIHPTRRGDWRRGLFEWAPDDAEFGEFENRAALLRDIAGPDDARATLCGGAGV